MRHRLLLIAGLLVSSMVGLVAVADGQQTLPVRNGRPAVAVVGTDSISLDMFLIESPQSDRARLLTGRATAEELNLVDRLVTIKLVVKESATMGLDKAPEIQKQVDVTSRQILRDVYVERLVKSIAPDPAAVERQYRDMVREWKTAALLFQSEAAAKQAQKELSAGAAFKDVSALAVGTKVATPGNDDAYHRQKEFLPQIAEAISRVRPGQVAPVIKLPTGFAVVKVLDLRYPENAEARAEARKKVVARQQEAFLSARESALRRDVVVVNESVLKSLDYVAPKPGLEALLKDKRTVAQIKGAASITVGDLTDYLRMQFYHGTDQAAQRKRMSEKKGEALNATIGRRLWNMEALKAGIDKTPAYRDRLNGYRESLVFGAFVEKVITPGNQMREDEVKAYYNGNLKDYSYPEMMKIQSVAFLRRDAAEAAIRKLREGTDFGWLAANATGQVGPGAPGLVKLDGKPVTTSSMPDGMQKALAGARARDLRLYASSEGHFYVLAVREVIAPSPKPYADVHDEIAKKLYGEKLNKSLKEYAEKLRARSKVETYLKRIQ